MYSDCKCRIVFYVSLALGLRGMEYFVIQTMKSKREYNRHKVTVALMVKVTLSKTSYTQVTTSFICSRLPLLLSASSKCMFWLSYNFISFGTTVPQWEMEKWLINQTQPLIAAFTSSQLLLSIIQKEWQSAHHYQLVLPSWEIILFKL